MIHILVNSITTLELIRRITILIVINLLDGVALWIHQHMSFIVDGYRSRLTLCQEFVNITAEFFGRPTVTFTLVNQPFVRILINSLITQSVDRTQWITRLDTIQVSATIIIRPFWIDRLEYAFVHLNNLIEVLADVEISTHREFTPFDETVGTDVQFPSLIGHLSNIGPSQRRESCSWRNANTAHQQVFGTLEIIVEVTSNQVVEETEVTTNVVWHGTLPLQFVQLQTFQINTGGTTFSIITQWIIFCILQILRTRLFTYDSPWWTEWKHGQPRPWPFHPRFIGDVPTCRNTREPTPLTTVSELGGTIDTHGEIQRIACFEWKVSLVNTRHWTPLSVARIHIAQVTIYGWRSNTIRDITSRYILAIVITRGNLPTSQHGQIPILVLEMRCQCQGMSCCKRQWIIIIART